jgi:hypothetical protein
LPIRPGRTGLYAAASVEQKAAVARRAAAGGHSLSVRSDRFLVRLPVHEAVAGDVRDGSGAFRVDKSDVVFIGDTLRCDIKGAKRTGLATVWINPARQSHSAADFVVGDLLELS